MNTEKKPLVFKRRKHFYKYMLDSPTVISKEQYQQIYSSLSESNETKRSKQYKYLLKDFSTTGKLLSTMFLLDGNGKKIRQNIISGIEGVHKRQHKQMIQKYNNIKKLFSREGIDDNFLLNSLFLFIENNGLHKKGKSIKKILLRFLLSYDCKKQTISESKLKKQFPNLQYYKCSDFPTLYL